MQILVNIYYVLLYMSFSHLHQFTDVHDSVAIFSVYLAALINEGINEGINTALLLALTRLPFGGYLF
jgi:hypothetical protein